jgi:hypothetical protein
MNETKPTRLSLCIMLARRNHMAGVLLERAVHWRQWSKATIPEVEGTWTANIREWWMQEAQLSYDQYDRASRLLATLGLIEKRQWWFAGRNMLFLRPTNKTLGFICSASTWKAAREYFAHYATDEQISDSAELTNSNFAEPPDSENAEAGSAKKLNPNGYSKFAEPSSAGAPNSKYINNTHGKLHMGKEQSCGLPASPAAAKIPKAPPKKEKPGNESKKKPVVTNAISTKAKLEWASTSAEEHKLSHLIAVWRAGMMKYFGKPAALSAVYGPSPKEKGSLAEMFERLGLFTNHEGVTVNFQPRAADILVHAVCHWDYFLGKHSKLPKIPTISVLYEKLFEEVFAHWNNAGRPSHGLNGI